MVRSALRLGLLALVCLAVNGVSSAAEDVKAAIDSQNTAWGAAVAKGDAAALAALYTETAKAYPPNGPAVAGRAAIGELFGGMLASGIRSIKLTASEVTGSGDSAQEVGTYVVKSPDGAVAEQGKYIVLWKKEGGQWKLHRDIWNSDAPAAKP
jgi:uncharacterized protein (TIGR02246 family)